LSYEPKVGSKTGEGKPALLPREMSDYSGRRGRSRTFGVNGRNSSFMRACSGVRPPLRWLQRRQQFTRLSQVVSPPKDWGVTWSSVASEKGISRPQ